MAPPELVEPCRHAWNPARGDSDRVVDELGSERDVELEQLDLAALRAETRHGDEEVEVLGLTARRFVVDRVPAAEQAGHHGLGDAGGERRGDSRVGGASTGAQDLDPRLDRGGMPCCDRRCHSTRIASEPMHTKPGRGKSKRSPRHSPSTISNSRSPTGRARTLG